MPELIDSRIQSTRSLIASDSNSRFCSLSLSSRLISSHLISSHLISSHSPRLHWIAERVSNRSALISIHSFAVATMSMSVSSSNSSHAPKPAPVPASASAPGPAPGPAPAVPQSLGPQRVLPSRPNRPKPGSLDENSLARRQIQESKKQQYQE